MPCIHILVETCHFPQLVYLYDLVPWLISTKANPLATICSQRQLAKHDLLPHAKAVNPGNYMH